MIKEALNTVSDLWSLMVGLRVTKDYFRAPQVTVRYPWKAVSNIATYKGHLELVGGKTGKPKCISCGMCALACPSNCLTVVKRKPPKPTPEEEQALAEAKAKGEKPKDKTPKDPEKFIYDFTLCSLCGTCMENCPVGALDFTGSAYLAGYSREDFHFDLVQLLKNQAGLEGMDASAAPETGQSEA
ncbi:MAG: 4Fe-4S binding protein [Humidesulfovibrio sp.]|uniref:4Fe-4S binding protein n=1 Tax=Humidesulfovibrio sp. TaxID=2910988 RepID=UPI0027EEAA62|nr:4Fe-4S binding protein [Humidesulfovibrio sp.]MDQ7835525.1 4Fe-4S binding protein [Humidesulfovibrio sp.]